MNYTKKSRKISGDWVVDRKKGNLYTIQNETLRLLHVRAGIRLSAELFCRARHIDFRTDTSRSRHLDREEEHGADSALDGQNERKKNERMNFNEIKLRKNRQKELSERATTIKTLVPSEIVECLTPSVA